MSTRGRQHASPFSPSTTGTGREDRGHQNRRTPICDEAAEIAPGRELGVDSTRDVENHSLTYSLVSDLAHGQLTLNPDGSCTYTPNLNFNGSDSFSFKANDGHADSNVATVNITVTPVNDAPTAQSQTVSVAEDGSVAITLVVLDRSNATNWR